MKFFLDFGHCWPDEDRGAVGVLAEEDVVKAVGNELLNILRSRGHEVQKTAVGKACSTNESLRNRVAQSNAFRPDLFISLHCNANEHTANRMGT